MRLPRGSSTAVAVEAVNRITRSRSEVAAVLSSFHSRVCPHVCLEVCMTRSALAFVAVLAASTGVLAQSPDIDTPLLAAPANMREGATVVKWKADFTYDTLKKGTNRLVCYDRSGQSGSAAVFARVHQHRQPGPRRPEHEVRGGGRQGEGAVRGRRKGRHAREARVRVGVLQPGRPRAREGPSPHHRRGPRRDGAIAGAARQQQAGRCVDHERRHVDRASDDPGVTPIRTQPSGSR